MGSMPGMGAAIMTRSVVRYIFTGMCWCFIRSYIGLSFPKASEMLTENTHFKDKADSKGDGQAQGGTERISERSLLPLASTINRHGQQSRRTPRTCPCLPSRQSHADRPGQQPQSDAPVPVSPGVLCLLHSASTRGDRREDQSAF